MAEARDMERANGAFVTPGQLGVIGLTLITLSGCRGVLMAVMELLSPEMHCLIPDAVGTSLIEAL